MGWLRQSRRLHLHERSNNSQAGEPEVLEGPGLAPCVEEGIQEQWDVRCGTKFVQQATILFECDSLDEVQGSL